MFNLECVSGPGVAQTAPFMGLCPPKRSGGGSSPGLLALGPGRLLFFSLNTEPASAGFASVGKPAEAGSGTVWKRVLLSAGPGLKALAWTRHRFASAGEAP